MKYLQDIYKVLTRFELWRSKQPMLLWKHKKLYPRKGGNLNLSEFRALFSKRGKQWEVSDLTGLYCISVWVEVIGGVHSIGGVGGVRGVIEGIWGGVGGGVEGIVGVGGEIEGIWGGVGCVGSIWGVGGIGGGVEGIGGVGWGVEV